jgi:hypothetical protein
MSIERWNEMFERLVQYKNRKHGEEAQEGGQMDKEDVSSSFDFWLDTQTKFWQNHKVGSDDILDERYQRLARLGGLGGIETVAKKGIISQEERWKRTDGKKGDPERMKCLESIGVVDDITTRYAKGGVRETWYDIYNQLLEFKQKHGHVKVPQDYNENKKLGRWVGHWRNKYREYNRTNGQKGDPVRMKHLESIGLVDDIGTGYAKKGVKGIWYDMYTQLLEFKQKHGHVKVPANYNENKKLGNWVRSWRSNYREYKRTNGQKGDPERMKCLESIGLVDNICIKIHHDEMMKSANVVVSTPMIVSSMSPTFSSNTQTITKEVPLLAGIKGEEKNGDNSGGVNHTQADSDFLGSELRGKGGFWV